MAKMADVVYPELEQRATGRYGIFTGSISAIRDLTDALAWTWDQAAKFHNFDTRTWALLVRFVREITRLDERCKDLGYHRNISADGAISRDGVSAAERDAVGEAIHQEMMSRVFSQQDLTIVEAYLGEATGLVKTATENFRRICELARTETGTGTGTEADEVDGLSQQRPSTSSPTRDVEQGPDSNGWPITPETMIKLMHDIGITNRPVEVSKRMVEMARGTHEQVEKAVTDLDQLNSKLDSFVSFRRLHALSHIVPARFADLQRSMDQMAGLLEGAVTTGGRDRDMQMACLNSLLLMPHVDWKRLEGALDSREINELNLLDVDGEEEFRNGRRRLVIYEDAASYEPEQVCLIEWNDSVIDDAAKQEQAREQLFNLVHLLALQDPQEYRVPRPLGWVELNEGDTCRYGIVYQLPEGFDAEKQMVLAVAITRILRQFQSCQWLHEAICPANIIFVAQKGPRGIPIPNLKEPFLTGFSFSRHTDLDSLPRKGEAVELDLYQHPLRRERANESSDAAYRYRGEFDIYSLGRVLLDIGKWDSIPADQEAASLLDLPKSMGKSYASVVKWCLGKDPASLVAVARIRGKKELAPSAQKWSASLIEAFDYNVFLKIIKHGL
ncbi:hypothetical protein EDB81DRAFT_689263 [Dactylonectria macrodidyma]|uniref:Protein kinase domain-containing protein n=1 Tax=Dactylonectria macrodidyma TaxID=307937 RepID=A0A9P9EVQ2_9HYPO|nr:hypothetical protein EDB81DRAFT_689263 [Dactylonectria macrodidyma]